MQRRTFLTLTGATVLAGLSGAETTLQDLEGRVGVPHSLATSSQAMVASITNPVAIRAGLDALKAGSRFKLVAEPTLWSCDWSESPNPVALPRYSPQSQNRGSPRFRRPPARGR